MVYELVEVSFVYQVKRVTSWAAFYLQAHHTSWAAFYHASRQSWFPKPDGALLVSQVPFMIPLANVDMRPADCDTLRDWASSYGAAVRQRTVRQETTMARHGTLPEFMHQRQCEVAEKPISIAFDA